MTTKTTDRTTSADLAALLNVSALEQTEAGRAKLLAENALYAAIDRHARALYYERKYRAEWERRLATAPATRGRRIVGTFAGCLVAIDTQEGATGVCGAATEATGLHECGPVWAVACEGCLAALDEVQP
jgi:hypothetical protein